MQKISAVIITKNEERNIGRCIDSLEGVVDEVVVIDSFSTDRTKEICLEKGVRFIENPFEGHIQQKNYAKNQAKYDYVLSLDADEALDEDLKKSILEVKYNWTKDGYCMNRLTNYCGKWIRYGEWYPDRKLRLWDRRKGNWGGLNPHDKFMMKKNASLGRLKGDILHYSFHSVFQHINQMNYLSEISAKSYFENKRASSLFHVIFSPLYAFMRSYVFKLGFLSGYYGFVTASVDAHFTFLKYVKIRELKKVKKKKNKSHSEIRNISEKKKNEVLDEILK